MTVVQRAVVKGHQEEFITRHRDLISPEAYAKKIVVVGAGAIGSFVVLSLAKMGYHNIHAYDFDTVEPENIGSQFFNIESIGKKKVDALGRMVWDFTGIAIQMHDREVKEGERLDAHIVISAVDNMKVRKMLYEASDCHYLIDPRMGAEYATMTTVKMDGSKSEHESYQKSLFSDEEAVRERCTAKTTIYTVLLIAGQVVKAVKDITTGSEDKRVTDLDWSIKDNAMLAFSNGRRL